MPACSKLGPARTSTKYFYFPDEVDVNEWLLTDHSMCSDLHAWLARDLPVLSNLPLHCSAHWKDSLSWNSGHWGDQSQKAAEPDEHHCHILHLACAACNQHHLHNFARILLQSHQVLSCPTGCIYNISEF